MSINISTTQTDMESDNGDSLIATLFHLISTIIRFGIFYKVISFKQQQLIDCKTWVAAYRVQYIAFAYNAKCCLLRPKDPPANVAQVFERDL